MKTQTTLVFEQGNGFKGVEVGADLFDSENNELVRVVALSMNIQTDLADNGGNHYLIAETMRSDRAPSDLTESQFNALPEVKLKHLKP